MAKLKKFAAVCAAAVMSLSLASCSDTSYVMSAGGNDVKAGVYIYNMVNEMYSQMTMMYYTNGVTDKYMDQKVDGKSFSDYLSEKAMQSTKEYTAITAKFNELKLKLDDEQVKSTNKSINDNWQSQKDMYENVGVSKESIKNVQKEALMKQALFDHFYAEGGEQAVSDDELKKYIDENFLRYKQVAIAKSQNTDKDAAKKEDEESQKLLEGYLKDNKDISFEDFDKIIDEYNDYLTKKSEEQNADSNSSADSDSVADDSAVDSDSSSDTSSEIDESSSDSENDVDSSEISDDSADSNTDSEQSEENSDPYPNENIVNYDTFDDAALKENSGKRITEIKNHKDDEIFFYKDDDGYFLFIKTPIKDRTETYLEENHDTVLQQNKSKDFDKMIASWIEKANITTNDKAIKRYTPQIIYDKYMEKAQNQ